MSGRTTIDALRIHGFGRFSDVEIELDRGLNLLVGPNEVGKSTLLAFIRAVLFGFERRQSPRRYEPRSGNAFGGELTLKTPSGTLVVQRSASRRRVEGELLLRDGEGAPVPAEALSAALGGANRELFNQVFAITVDELQDFQALASESSVSEALFAAGMQGAHRLPEALSTLSAQASAVWGERAQKRPLNLALLALSETRGRLDACTQRPEAYFEAVTQRSELERELEQTRGELDGLRRRAQHLERLQRARGPLLSLASLGADVIQDDGSPEALPRFESLEARRFELARQRSTLSSQALELEAAHRALEASSSQRGSLAETRAALAAWQAVVSLSRGLGAREVELFERKRSLEARLGRLLGRFEGAEWLASVDVGASRIAELQALRDREVRVSGERARAEEAVAGADLERERLTRSREAAEAELVPGAPSAESVAAAIDALEQFNALGLKLEQLEARRLAVRERLALSAELAPAQAAGPGTWAPLVSLVGLALMVAGLVVFSDPTVGVVAVAGGVIAGLAVVAWVLKARRAEAQAAAERAEASSGHRRGWGEEAEVLGQEMSGLTVARCALARTAGLSSEAAASTRAQELARARHLVEHQERLRLELAQLARDLSVVAEKKGAAGRRLASATAELDALREEVDRRAVVAGLPLGLFAQQTVDLMGELARLQDEWSHLHRDVSGYEGDRRLVQAAHRELGQQAGRLGLDTEASSAVLAEALTELLAHDEEERGALSQARVRLEEVRAALSRLDGEAYEVEGRMRALLDAVGAPDGEALRVRAPVVLEARSRAQRRRELTVEVEAAAGMAPEEARRALDGEGDLGQTLQGVRHSVAGLEERMTGAAGKLGQLEERTKAMESESQAAALRLEEAAQLARVGHLAREHAELALATALLQRARQRFEQAHQPRIVKRAQGFFGELTGQRYVGLTVDVPNQSLQVHDAQGAPWSVEHLSRGTRELLLLAFRLSVVEDFGESRVRLPLVLDDVLVDLDADRAERLVRQLASFSQRHQVIALTCHRHVRQLFQAAEAHVVSLQQGVQLSLLGDQRG